MNREPHTVITEIMNDISRVRLGTEHDYYNTGRFFISAERENPGQHPIPIALGLCISIICRLPPDNS
ncbi:hypothetical protein [Lacrimispora sp.]|uniref:hypothetical protein n=1 Tax=Lacrimispora sp. TaxID=2719234 RepID=UPI0028AFD1C8|nr:hypothetical protein [Lacrimispora sp.]